MCVQLQEFFPFSLCGRLHEYLGFVKGHSSATGCFCVSGGQPEM